MSSVTFEASTTLKSQARWMWDHDVIVAAHGTALINAAFIRPGTIVMELFPPNYYVAGFFQPLIFESGGFALNWHQGDTPVKDMRDNWENHAHLRAVDFAPGAEDVVAAILKKVQDADACPVLKLDHSQFSSHHELYKAVHESAFPACIAGSWIHHPSSRMVLSEEHLRCLDQERQGNCHDPDAWKHTNDTAKHSRHKSMLKEAVLNSPGILNASDPWVWTSDLEQYKALPMDNRGEYISRVRKLFGGEPVTIFFVGDSLTRQWSHAMKCELEHVVGIPPDRVGRAIRMLSMHTGWSDDLLKKRYQDPFRNATKRDYVVFNFGHHVGKKLGKDWPSEYARRLNEAFRVDFGRIPDHHVFFRTTTVRHFLANQGDWNTENSKAGGIHLNPEAQWSWYGGNSPELPMQNLLAFDAFLAPGRHFRILDTSPMMLSRADASFDGSHFCLPGPMDFWSRMLYYQMEQ